MEAKTFALILIAAIFCIAIEYTHKPRFGYTKEGWIILFYGKVENGQSRKYLKIIQI